MDTKEKNRYVGGLLGAGTILVMMAVLNIGFYPSWWQSVWALNLVIGVIGTILIITALIIQKKY